MNDVELLALGDALARTSDILRRGEHVSFRDYLARVLRSEEQIAALFGETAFHVSVDGRPVDGARVHVARDRRKPCRTLSAAGAHPWTCSPGAWSGGSA